jgi:aerobic carbon-monoxide dehydrogenase medium subunit
MHTPDTLDAASVLLTEFGDEAGVYAGGTELLLVMKAGFRHFNELVDVKKIPRLRFIDWQPGTRTLVVGAATTHRDIELSPLVAEHLPILVEMERSVANVRVRTQGTLGGNLCFAEPHSDPATLLLALEASVSLFSRNAGARTIPLHDFILDAFSTDLRPGEVMTSVQIPAPSGATGVAYKKFALHERPTLGVAAAVDLDAEGGVAASRIAIGCVGPKPVRVPHAEALLERVAADRLQSAGARAAAAAAESVDAIDDLHGSAEYKRHLVEVFVRRAIEEAASRARASGPRS